MVQLNFKYLLCRLYMFYVAKGGVSACFYVFVFSFSESIDFSTDMFNICLSPSTIMMVAAGVPKLLNCGE